MQIKTWVLAVLLGGTALGAGAVGHAVGGNMSVDGNAQGNSGSPHTVNGCTEEILEGDIATKVKAAAEASVPEATVDRVETDCDEVAKYEAHLIRSDDTRATIFIDEAFAVVSTQEGYGPGESDDQEETDSSGEEKLDPDQSEVDAEETDDPETEVEPEDQG